jgi:hypothetical protein
MVEYKIRIYLISEIEKNLNYTIDIESTKLLTLKNTKESILKYISEKSKDNNVTVQPNTIEDYMMDELSSNRDSNFESVYLYIFPYILEYIDDYLDKVYIRHKSFAIHPIVYNNI